MCEGRGFQTRRDLSSSWRSLNTICIALYAVDLRSISVPLGANSARLSVDISSTSVSLDALGSLSLTTAAFVSGSLEMRIFLSRFCMKF